MLIFNFFVNRNGKKLADSRKRAKIFADNRKCHHPIETLLFVADFPFGSVLLFWSATGVRYSKYKEWSLDGSQS